jgi:[ribosomal protein S18]-alanine N-acetyltransferase
MSAVLKTIEARFEPLTSQRLEAVLAIEQLAYAQPWSRGSFTDSLRCGYQAQLLMGEDALLGYFIAMRVLDEVHLLNLTVAPAHQRQGWGRVLLDALAIWARGQGALWLWLEVRVSNQRAQQMYERHGYRRVGLRKAYYPARQGQREDAVIMSLSL